MKVDITGQRFGLLTAVREVEKKGRNRFWLCKCDCGNEKKISRSNLRKNKGTRSCGCLKFKDITGHVFGRLTVVQLAEVTKTGQSMWICKCECGNKKIIRRSSLISGSTRSCGCLRKNKKGEPSSDKQKKAARAYQNEHPYEALKRKIKSDNKSGVKGVSFNKKTKKWIANIKIHGKQIYLGSFNDKEMAIAARKTAEEKYHKPYL